MRDFFINIVLLPVFCMAYAVMLLHNITPEVWRCYVRPAVCRMREYGRQLYVFPGRMRRNSGCLSRPLVSFFNNEIKTVIRLIRLESADVEAGIGVLTVRLFAGKSAVAL